MDQTLITEIGEVRKRLEEIEAEREEGSATEDSRQQLLEEEHQLEIRLVELEDRATGQEAATAQEKAAAQTDLTRTPELPTKAEENDSHHS